MAPWSLGRAVLSPIREGKELVCAGHHRMRADGPDARDCREPSVGVMVEDLVPTGASQQRLVFLVTTKKRHSLFRIKSSTLPHPDL